MIPAIVYSLKGFVRRRRRQKTFDEIVQVLLEAAGACTHEKPSARVGCDCGEAR